MGYLFNSNFNLFLNPLSVIVIILSIGVTFLQLYDAKSEYFSTVFIRRRAGDWCIHHDEKLIIPDARYFFLKKNNKDISLQDFISYPISGAYGIAGPLLASIGFKIFGMNNVGLRLFFILISGMANLCCALILIRISPGLTGIVFSLIYIINYNNFVLNRYAIVEHILTLFLTGIFTVYIVNPVFFINNIQWICFIAATAILVKHYFVLYVYILIFIIAIIERLDFFETFSLSFYSIGGVIFFESIQLCILSKLGIAKGRYSTVLRGINQLSGTGKWVSLTGHLKPAGKDAFKNYLSNFIEWYVSHKKLSDSVKKMVQIVAALLFLLFLVYAVIFGLRCSLPRPSWALIIFICAYLISLIPFYYYLKRVFSIFPFTVILLSVIFQVLNNKFLDFFPNGANLIVIALIVFLIWYITVQVLTVTRFSVLRSHCVAKNSASLDDDLPKGSIIYTHCYGYRFFWQVENHRLMSSDDTMMNNQMIVDWAVKNHAKYVMLAYGNQCAGSLEPETERLLRPIKKYYSTELTSDYPQTYKLCEIIV